MRVLERLPGITRRSALRLALLAATVTGLALPQAGSAEPAGPEFEKLVAAAKEEGSLTFYYAITDAVAAKWYQPFIDKYGIRIDGYRANTNTILEKFDREATAGKNLADLVVLADIAKWTQAIDKDLIADYTPAAAVDFDENEIIPGKFYPLYFSSYAVAWNTSHLKPEEIEMLRQDPLTALKDPRWGDGRVGLAVPQSSITTYGTYSKIVNHPDFGWDFMQLLADHEPKIYTTGPANSSALVQGEIDVTISANDGTRTTEILKGAPIEFRFPDQFPVVSSGYGIGVAKQAPHPNAARLFMEWATSEEAQASISDLMQIRAGNKKVGPPSVISEYPWYAPPKAIDQKYSEDPAFASQQEDFFNKWNGMFGYEP